MARTRLGSTPGIREEQLREDLEFRAYWERTALARAVALAVIGHYLVHRLTQVQLTEQLGVRQRQMARLELGEQTPSLEVLRLLAEKLGLRFVY